MRHLYNDVQQDLQHKTRVLEDVVTQRVPQLYHYAYQFDWEYGYLPGELSQFYQTLVQHDYHVITYRWESQQITDIDSGVTDYGANFTHPWEGYMISGGYEIKMRYPQNLNAMKYIAYDEEPIYATTKKRVQSNDTSYLTRTGQPFAYYSYDETDNSYVLYPRPSSGFANDLSGEGLAFYESGDTESDTTGIIATRDDSTPSALYGGSADIVETVNNVFMVYEVSPNDLVAMNDESDFPVFLRKYIRQGVASKAYGANTDGRIPSLESYWKLRYELGIEFIKQYVRSRREDRDYRLKTQGVRPLRSRRYPRLPDGYPAINP